MKAHNHTLPRLVVALFLLMLSAASAAQTARLQVAHLAPFAAGNGSSVTVRLNGANALTNVLYGNSTAYLDVPAGATDRVADRPVIRR
jgi:tripartite-type tricarboxylate transporter receptor subunit TctC